MILNVTAQKNNTIAITAPDGTIWPVKLPKGETTDAQKDEVRREIGDAILQILADPKMPEKTTVAAPNTKAEKGDGNGNGESPEAAFRGLLNSFIPGGEKVLDFMQDISSDAPE